MRIKFLALGLILVGAACSGGGERPAQQEAAEGTPAATPAAAPTASAGEQVYNNVCVVCHQPGGTGMQGAFPPLAGSAMLQGDPTVPIRVVLHGLSGEMTRGGTTYNGVMTPWGSQLSDADVANVLTYTRSSWGNSAPAVTEAQVAEVRAATEARAEPFTTTELGIK